MKWTAFYTDGKLEQFDGTEHLFSEIDQERLIEFKLDNATISLVSGDINLNGIILTFGDKFKDQKLRLVYFKRIRQHLGPNEGPEIQYYYGWQTTINGKNYKRIVTVKENKIFIDCD